MTRTATSPASPPNRARQNDARRGNTPSQRDSLGIDERIAARLSRYSGDATPSAGALRHDAERARSRPRPPAAGPVIATARAGFANPTPDNALASADTTRRIEAVIAATTEAALAHIRGELAEKTKDIAPLLAALRRLETLEGLPARLSESLSESLAESLTALLDHRLDTVDDHLADLTQAFTAHPAWDVEGGLARVHEEVATLGAAVDATARNQLTETLVRQILEDTINARPQLALEDLDVTITQPMLAAIETAVARLAEPVGASAMDLAATDADAAFVDSVRSELATARAGQTADIQKVETRLSSLQDSVVALTEQLRLDREANERADAIAHANAMAFAATRENSRNGPMHWQDPGIPAPQPADFPGLPRAAQLTGGESAATAEAKSRFIVAARRASVGARDPQRAPAASNNAARRPSAANGAAKHKALTRWLRGKGLLWAVAVLVTAGAMPLLAPALRALPDAMLQAVGTSATKGSATSASQAPQKIGSQLATAATLPASIVDDPAALYALGDRIAEGSSVGSPKLAASLLEKAAERGQAPAQYRIARLYEKGAGVAMDMNKARDWYVRAAEQGNIRAMHNLAVLNAEGAIGTVDYATAAQWFRKAAEHGLADSQFNLAVLLARGLGGAANPGEAWAWFDIGARNGDGEAATRRDEIGATLTPAALEAARANAAKWRVKPGNALANDPPASSRPQVPGVSAGTGSSKSASPV